MTSLTHLLRKSASRYERQRMGLPPHFNRDKQDIIDYTFQRLIPHAQSFADLGGIWGVDGAYSFYTMLTYPMQRGYILDVQFPDSVRQRAAKLGNVELIQGQFESPDALKALDRVDAIFFFDVLLHQANPSWADVLEMYSERTDCFVIFNQQYIASESTVRLLDLGKEGFFENCPHDPNDPLYIQVLEQLDEPDSSRPGYLVRDNPSIWQWGITDKDLMAKIESLGYGLQYYKNCGQFEHLKNFENHAFVYLRK